MTISPKVFLATWQSLKPYLFSENALAQCAKTNVADYETIALLI
jgi:hypothetical protein